MLKNTKRGLDACMIFRTRAAEKDCDCWDSEWRLGCEKRCCVILLVLQLHSEVNGALELIASTLFPRTESHEKATRESVRAEYSEQLILLVDGRHI